MRLDSQLQLLVMIEDTLALADAEQAYEVALWLDRARIAAGGPGEIDPKRLTFLEEEEEAASDVPAASPQGDNNGCSCDAA